MAEPKPLPNGISPQLVDRMDKQFVEIYNKYQAPYLRADQVDIEEYRAHTAKYTYPITPGPKPEVGKVEQFQVQVHKPTGQILVQVYSPEPDSTTTERLPVHLNFHGGGWVIGSLKSDEAWCRQACRATGIIIVDVDYRLAPEFPFPTQIWDAWAVLQWLMAVETQRQLHIDASRMSIGGLSAGANIAAALAIMARDAGNVPQLKLQLLTVPTVDVRSIPIRGGFDTSLLPYYETYRTCEHAPCLPLQRMVWFCKHWLGENEDIRKANAANWMASPISALSHQGLPPASIYCAEFDVLRSEAEAYHLRLVSAGVKSTFKEYKGVAHPFGRWDGGLDKGKEYVRDTIAALRTAHQI